jgi:hypothetical protein
MVLQVVHQIIAAISAGLHTALLNLASIFF